MASIKEVSDTACANVTLGIINGQANDDLKKKLAALQAVTDEAAGVLNAASGSAPTNNNDAMVKLTAVLQQLQVFLVQMDQKKAENTSGISKAFSAFASQMLKSTLDDIAQIEEKQRQSKITNIFLKVIGAIVGVILSLTLSGVGCAIGILITIALATGLVEKMAKGFTSALVAAGMNKEDAAALGSFLAIAVVFAVSMGANIGATAAAAGEAGAAAAEAEVKTLLDKAMDVLKFAFKAFSAETNMAIVNSMQALVATGFPMQAADALAKTLKLSDEEKQKLEEAFNIIFQIITLLASIGAGGAAADAALASEAGGAMGLTKKLEELIKKLSLGFLTLEKVRGGLNAANSAFEIAGGAIQTEQGVLEIDLAALGAYLQLGETAMQRNSDQMKEDQTQDTHTMEEAGVNGKMTVQLTKGLSKWSEVLGSVFSRA